MDGAFGAVSAIERICFLLQNSVRGGVSINLTPMRFKDYTWPHNPETYTVEFRRQVVAHKVPFGR